MRVMSNGRVRRTAEEWSEILARFRAGDSSPSEFCRTEELHLASFLRWQRKLGVAQRAAEFVKVSRVPAAGGPWAVEIVLPNGCRVRLQG
jgi:hypothetical protein